MPHSDVFAVLPVMVLVVWACVLLLLDQFVIRRKGITALLAAAGLALALGLELVQAGSEMLAFGGMLAVDGFSVFLGCLLLISGLFGVALAYDYLRRAGIEKGEYYALILFSLSGMLLMTQANDLIVVFISIELLSIPLYILSALAYPRVESEEAGLKYFLLGAFASGFFVYGTALVYGAAGSTQLQPIVDAISAGSVNIPLLVLGGGLMLVGLGFKVAVVPFHMWMPDVYQGAPTSVTAFMAAGAKVAGFAALLRVFSMIFPSVSEYMTPILAVVAALTMIVGNMLAIPQTNIKRMLAYSSIAQAGYILMAFVPYGSAGMSATVVSAAVFYLLTYTLTSFGAWAVVIALEKADPLKSSTGLEINDFAGVGRKYPALAAAMTVFMLSFTGIPPTLGFVGKFYLFVPVIDAGLYWLAVVGVLASLISAYYYLRVVVMMYMREGTPERTSEPWLNFTWALAAIVTVAFSLFPSLLLGWAAQAALISF